jgi:TonB family protein
MFSRVGNRLLAAAASASLLASMSTGLAAQEGARKVKTSVTPVYPELAKRINLSGTVNIEVTITPSGTVKAAKVIGGSPVLVQSALEAVKRWKYEPGPVETTQVVTFNFHP